VKFNIVAYGKAGSRFAEEEVQKYLQRIQREVPCQFIELKEKSHKDPSTQARMEYELFSKKVGFAQPLCVLSEEGKQMDTLKMAKWLEANAQNGMNFVIGSAYGFAPEMKQKAQHIISLSSLTFTHDHARVILTEQLYRCLMVLKGHPYHHQ
jgi:23S rRNA (pseudouridine1915-N3)-methyltransferase